MIKSLIGLVCWTLLPLLAGALGSLATISKIPTWYASLDKPFFNPPNWIFSPVWTTLYILMGIAAWLVWQKGWEKKEVKTALLIFMAQLVLNAVWSFIFFGQQQLLLAFFEIILLWLLIVLTIVKFWPLSRWAGWLLTPYLAWVSFASFLNLSVWWLNR